MCNLTRPKRRRFNVRAQFGAQRQTLNIYIQLGQHFNRSADANRTMATKKKGAKKKPEGEGAAPAGAGGRGKDRAKAMSKSAKAGLQVRGVCLPQWPTASKLTDKH